MSNLISSAAEDDGHECLNSGWNSCVYICINNFHHDPPRIVNWTHFLQKTQSKSSHEHFILCCGCIAALLSFLRGCITDFLKIVSPESVCPIQITNKLAVLQNNSICLKMYMVRAIIIQMSFTMSAFRYVLKNRLRCHVFFVISRCFNENFGS